MVFGAPKIPDFRALNQNAEHKAPIGEHNAPMAWVRLRVQISASPFLKMNSKIIHTADLHGNMKFYKRLLRKSEEENCFAVIIGGDLCGRGGATIKEKIKNQRLFLEKFMIPLFGEFKEKNKGTEVYAIMGNDDFRANFDVLEEADKKGILGCIHKKPKKLNERLNITGYSFVNPTPFRLKDWEKPDFKGQDMPRQLFDTEIRSVKKESGTIEDDLKKIKRLSSPKKTVYVIHAPPLNTNLDVITAGAHVGSKAIREFIEKEQPPLTLHGHIHESPRISGSWKDKIGKTDCINVGSSFPIGRLNCAVIDLERPDSQQYFEV
jgi:uncharacterized protein